MALVGGATGSEFTSGGGVTKAEGQVVVSSESDDTGNEKGREEGMHMG